VLSLLVASCLMGVALCACPPAGFDSVANLDLVKYMTGPWYSQQQVRGSRVVLVLVLPSVTEHRHSRLYG
jgi:hypothetical protein